MQKRCLMLVFIYVYVYASATIALETLISWRKLGRSSRYIAHNAAVACSSSETLSRGESW